MKSQGVPTKIAAEKIHTADMVLIHISSIIFHMHLVYMGQDVAGMEPKKSLHARLCLFTFKCLLLSYLSERRLKKLNLGGSHIECHMCFLLVLFSSPKAFLYRSKTYHII